MELKFAGVEINALDVIDQNSAFYVINNDWKGKRVWFATASERAHDGEPTALVIPKICQN
jgi:hypothetical protein